MYENIDLKAAELKIANYLFHSPRIVGNFIRSQKWYRDLAHSLAKSFYQTRIELETKLIDLS